MMERPETPLSALTGFVRAPSVLPADPTQRSESLLPIGEECAQCAGRAPGGTQRSCGCNIRASSPVASALDWALMVSRHATTPFWGLAMVAQVVADARQRDEDSGQFATVEAALRESMLVAPDSLGVLPPTWGFGSFSPFSEALAVPYFGVGGRDVRPTGRDLLEAFLKILFRRRYLPCLYYLMLLLRGDPYGAIGFWICLGMMGTKSNPFDPGPWPKPDVDFVGVDDDWDDCVRDCLIASDMKYCKTSRGFDSCRERIHFLCWRYCEDLLLADIPMGFRIRLAGGVLVDRDTAREFEAWASRQPWGRPGRRR